MAGITTGFGELLRTGSYSDFKITCKGAVFNVHKAIVCSASDFFKTMCDSGFKEQSEGSVDLPDDDLAIVKCVIDFIYTGTYGAYTVDAKIDNMSFEEEASVSSSSSEHASTTEDQEPEDDHGSTDPWEDRGPWDWPFPHPDDQRALQPTDKVALANLKNHTLVYEIADKFGMQSLSNYALSRFKEELNGLSETARHHKNFVDILTLVYESTSTHDHGLRAYATRDCIIWIPPLGVIPHPVRDVVEKYEPMAFHLGRQMQAESNAPQHLQHNRSNETRGWRTE